MEDVQKWFDTGCEYTQGLALYAKCPGMLPVLFKRLSKGNTPYNLDKLTHELKKHIPQKPSPKRDVVKTVPKNTGADLHQVKAEEKKQALMFHQLPAELRPVYKQAMDLFRDNCLLKTELNDLRPEMESEALTLQLRIFDNLKKNALCWQKINYWQEHKRLPVTKASQLTTLTAAALVKKQQHLFSSISRLKKRLAANITVFEIETAVHKKTLLERAVAKQRANLMRQEEDLQEITNLIDGTHGAGTGE